MGFRHGVEGGVQRDGRVKPMLEELVIEEPRAQVRNHSDLNSIRNPDETREVWIVGPQDLRKFRFLRAMLRRQKSPRITR